MSGHFKRKQAKRNRRRKNRETIIKTPASTSTRQRKAFTKMGEVIIRRIKKTTKRQRNGKMNEKKNRKTVVSVKPLISDFAT